MTQPATVNLHALREWARNDLSIASVIRARELLALLDAVDAGRLVVQRRDESDREWALDMLEIALAPFGGPRG